MEGWKGGRREGGRKEGGWKGGRRENGGRKEELKEGNKNERIAIDGGGEERGEGSRETQMGQAWMNECHATNSQSPELHSSRDFSFLTIERFKRNGNATYLNAWARNR